jgi:hypothetical protein
MAGNHMDEAIMNYLKRKYNLLIGERTAEQIKTEIGSAHTLDKPLTMEIKGRSLIEGIPKAITVDDSEIREALSECGVRVDHRERRPGGVGAHAAGALRRYQRPRHRARRRRRLTEKPGQANPGRNGAAGMRR